MENSFWQYYYWYSWLPRTQVIVDQGGDLSTFHMQGLVDLGPDRIIQHQACSVHVSWRLGHVATSCPSRVLGGVNESKSGKGIMPTSNPCLQGGHPHLEIPLVLQLSAREQVSKSWSKPTKGCTVQFVVWYKALQVHRVKMTSIVDKLKRQWLQEVYYPVGTCAKWG